MSNYGLEFIVINMKRLLIFIFIEFNIFHFLIQLVFIAGLGMELLKDV